MTARFTVERDVSALAALAAHAVKTGDVHGVDDMLVLVNDADLAAHAATTADVHGIEDTTVLELTTSRDQPSGYPSLDEDGKVSVGAIPAISVGHVFVVASEAEQIALDAVEGDFARRTDLGNSWIHNGGTAGTIADWTAITAVSSVTSVAGRTGDVSLSMGDVSGLTAALPSAYLVPTAPATGKGRLITWTGGQPPTGHPIGVAPGTTGQILSLDFTTTSGFLWIDQPAGGGGAGSTFDTVTLNSNQALDITGDSVFVVTVTASPVSLTLEGASAGDYIEIYVVQDATGGRIYNGPPADWEAGIAPVSSTAANSVDAYAFRCIDDAGRLIGYDLGRGFS